MPECIVCKRYYKVERHKEVEQRSKPHGTDNASGSGGNGENVEVEQRCEHCGSDNSAWEEWKREEEALGPAGALCRFLEPHFALPLVIAGWALIFGLLGMLWPWGGIRPSMLVLAVALTFVGCVLTVPSIYEKRFDLREQELLRTIKRGWKKGIGIDIQALIIPAIVLGLAVFLTLFMIQSSMLWELMEEMVLEPRRDTTTVEEVSGQEETPGEGDLSSQEMPGLRERAERVFPLMCLSGYVTLAAFAYSSSLLLAQVYIKRLNNRLPHPIFLQDKKLAQIVRWEAEIELGRLGPESKNFGVTTHVQVEGQIAPHHLRLPPSVDMPVAEELALPPQINLRLQAATWVWDELERTDDGGIKMKVARQEIYQLPKPTDESDHRPHPRVCYVVRADPWGRIIEIRREAEGT